MGLATSSGSASGAGASTGGETPTVTGGAADTPADAARQRWLQWARNRRKRPLDPPVPVVQPRTPPLTLPPAEAPVERTPEPVELSPAPHVVRLLSANLAAMREQRQVAHEKIIANLAIETARILREAEEDEDDVLALLLED